MFLLTKEKEVSFALLFTSEREGKVAGVLFCLQRRVYHHVIVPHNWQRCHIHSRQLAILPRAVIYRLNIP